MAADWDNPTPLAHSTGGPSSEGKERLPVPFEYPILGPETSPEYLKYYLYDLKRALSQIEQDPSSNAENKELLALRRRLRRLSYGFRAREITFLWRSTPVDVYREIQHETSAVFSYLSVRDALRLFPRLSLSAILLACGAYASSYLTIISRALAQQPTFTPPLGLSQSVFTGIVLGFFSLFILLVAGLFYAGFLAKRKNKPAADAVSHLVTFLSGALLGLKAG